MVWLIGFIIGYLIGVILSEIVADLTDECLLFYMLLPFAWILMKLGHLFSPFRHIKFSWWSIKHGISPYGTKMDKFYELNDDDWNDLMNKFCKDRRDGLDRRRNRYLKSKNECLNG